MKVFAIFSILSMGLAFSMDATSLSAGVKNNDEVIRKIDPRVRAAFKDVSKAGDPVRVMVHIQTREKETFDNSRAADPVAAVAAEVYAQQSQALQMLEAAMGRHMADVEVVDLLTLNYVIVARVPSMEYIQKIAELDFVTEIEYDTLRTLFTDEGRAITGSILAAQNGYTGDGVGVAVIDSNFDLLHPELGGSTSLPNGVVYDGYNYSDPGDPIHSQSFNDCYHGTGTASIVRRYASDCSLYCLTVFPNAYDSVIANAMNWCITNKNGSNGGDPIKVISMSLGGGQYYSECNSGTMHDAANNCLSNGILVFAASGNDGWTSSMGSPACSNKVISVGSVWDEDGAAYSPFPPANCSDYSRQVNERTCYSDTASFLDVYAPSEEVICAQCGGGTWALGGTSSACPAAAGMTAQFLEAQPGYAGNKSGLVSLYQSTGVQVIGDTSHYRIDLEEALGLNQNDPPIANLTASPTSITVGGSATLSWTTTNATSASISNVGTVSPVSSGSVTVSPTTTTTYTLTATGPGGTDTDSVTVTVSGSGGGDELANGVSESFSLATNDIVEYTIPVPANCTNLTVTISGSGDADLYVKRAEIDWPGDKGSHNEAEFKAPYQSGSSESVSFTNPAQDTWHVLVHGYSASSGSIVASWETGSSGGGEDELVNGESVSFSLATNDIVEYTIPVPANCTSLNVTISGSGDADLYVKRAEINWPGDKGAHDEAEFKAPYKTGSSESVTFTNPAEDTWHVLVHGYSASSGSIVANWETGSSGGGEEWHYVDFVEQTPHNYANNKTYTFTYEYPGASSVAVHFETLNTESGYDFLYVYDENNTQLYKVSGSLISSGSGSAFGRTDGWLVVTGSKVTVRLVTDYSVTRYGYLTDTAAAYY